MTCCNHDPYPIASDTDKVSMALGTQADGPNEHLLMDVMPPESPAIEHAIKIPGVTRKQPGLLDRLLLRKYQPQVYWVFENDLLVVQNHSVAFPAILVAGGFEIQSTWISAQVLKRMIEILEYGVIIENDSGQRDFEFDLSRIPETDRTRRRFVLDKCVEFEKDHIGKWGIRDARFNTPLHPMNTSDWNTLLIVLRRIQTDSHKLGVL